MIRVGVFGAGGRMGSTVCAAVAADPELELVAAVDPYHSGIDLQQLGVDGSGVQVARSAVALLDVEDRGRRIALRELYRRSSQIGNVVVDVAERLMYAVIKQS